MSLNPWTVLQTAQLFIQQQQSGGMNSSGLMADLNEIYQQQVNRADPVDTFLVMCSEMNLVLFADALGTSVDEGT